MARTQSRDSPTTAAAATTTTTTTAAARTTLGSRISNTLGLTQNKIHHRVLQGNWTSILRRLQTPEGKKLARKPNPCGDLPLHLACYGGQTPPVVVRALIAAHPAGVFHRNQRGFVPLQLARTNYRTDHPFRRDVIGFLEAYSVRDSNDNSSSSNDNDSNNNNNNSNNNSNSNSNSNNNSNENENNVSHHPNRNGCSNSNGNHNGCSDGVPRLITTGEYEAGTETLNTYQVSGNCVICLEHAADCVVVPCGHQCLCAGCAKKVIASGGSGTKHNNNSTYNNNGNSNGNGNPETVTTTTTTTQGYFCPVGRCPIRAIVKESVLLRSGPGSGSGSRPKEECGVVPVPEERH